MNISSNASPVQVTRRNVGQHEDCPNHIGDCGSRSVYLLVSEDVHLPSTVQMRTELPNADPTRKFVIDDTKIPSSNTCTSAMMLNYGKPSLLSSCIRRLPTASRATPLVPACTSPRRHKSKMTLSLKNLRTAPTRPFTTSKKTATRAPKIRSNAMSKSPMHSPDAITR